MSARLQPPSGSPALKATKPRTSTQAAQAAHAGTPARPRWLALAVLCVTVLIANLDNTVLNVALPTLVRDLNATSTDLQWITDAYIIVFAGLLLAAGSLADRVGRQKTFLAGLAIFAAGSAGPPLSVGGGAPLGARGREGGGGGV